ncbi:MAG: hypothetical protein ACXADL_12680 [Candidatus Thorarchaeota archaeon]|jgi:pentose-5-phosphate-3-epimerase
MNYSDAVKLIEQVLRSANMTLDMHMNVQNAWKMIKAKAEGAEDGNDAIPVQRAVQPSQ